MQGWVFYQPQQSGIFHCCAFGLHDPPLTIRLQAHRWPSSGTYRTPTHVPVSLRSCHTCWSSLYSLESWLCGAAYMSIEYHCRLLRFAHSCIEIEFLSMWTSVRRWRWNSPVQELLYSTCQSSRRHCTRRRMSTKARVWLLSCAMHMYGIFLLDSTALDPRTHLGIAVLFPLYFGLQACMIWTERQWPQFFSGVWWTRCAVLTTAQLVVWPSLRSTDL
eukprot:COSAG02_NODE_1725_length_11184_cov_171.211728_7_plen_218_part_00